MAESKGIVQTLSNNVRERKRLLLALRYHNMTPAYVARLVRRVQTLSTAKLVSGLNGAVTKGELSEAETTEVLQADLVVQGKRGEDGTEVYLVAKISWAEGPHDVERASGELTCWPKRAPRHCQ